MSADSVRLDRWLWAARFFKTRALASAAIAGRKVHVIVLDPAHLQRQSAEIDVTASRIEIHLRAEGRRHLQRDVAGASLDVYRPERRHERHIHVAAAGLERQLVA